MKLTKGKKIALTCFAVFLGFMAVCTVTAKGIYASGLPQVYTAKTYGGSLTHVIKMIGTVMQGQEYGVYAEPGLRVDTVCVGKGDTFQKEEPLFRISPGDLADIIAKRSLEISKLEAQLSEAVKEDSRERQARKRAAERAWEDYDREAVLADTRIQECLQAYDAAQRALVLYNQYLENAASIEESGAESTLSGENGAESTLSGESGEGAGTDDGSEGNETGNDDSAGTPAKTSAGESPEGDELDAGAEPETGAAGSETGDGGITEESGSLHEVASVATDPEDQYNKEEKRRQLEQNVIEAAQALAEAERQKEDRLQTAARAAEDADAAIETANAAVNTLALEIAYQKERLQGLEELLAAEGWVYAQASGRVTDSRLEVGERTQDRACLLYALDDGERIISAALDEEQAERISSGIQFDMKTVMSDGNRITGTALVDYVEKGADGRLYARLSFDQPEISIGQSVELSCWIQTENYGTCVPAACVYEEGADTFYVYIAEERQGILGAEWKVRKVYVQIVDRNDTAAAIQSMEITADSRIVAGTNKPLADGDTVRVVQ